MNHNFYMQKALDLALRGQGAVSPNPMVGCVIVHQNKIIGEGYHQRYGEAHAEVNAILSVNDKDLLPFSTAYVTLEPCSHFGKTPPCADLLIRNKIKTVVVACKDPNPIVAGNGIKKLLDAGIEVIVGVLEKEAQWLNRRFFHFMEKQQPYIILKWAQTADAFIARKNFDSKWISNEQSRSLVHKWRTEEDAIMVGTNTALYDNPQLNARLWKGRNPIRLVIDLHLRLPESLYLFDGTQQTFCFNYLKDSESHLLRYVKINQNENVILQINSFLFKNKIQSVIVEGGSYLLNQFIKLNLWNEIKIFQSKTNFKEGISAPNISFLKPIQKTDIFGDTLIEYYNENYGLK